MLIFLNVVENIIIRSYLEEIYNLYSKELFYIANCILDDYHEAEDVVQTAFIKFADYIDDKMNIESKKTKGLLFIIVRNLSFDVYRRRKKHGTINIDDIAEVLHDDACITPEISILRLDQSQELAKILSKINGDYADILTLKYVYEYGDREISKLLNISEGNVRTRVSRSKKALIKVMNRGVSYEY